eukprot:RCo004376
MSLQSRPATELVAGASLGGAAGILQHRSRISSAGALVRNPYADSTAKDMVAAVKQGFFGVDRSLVDPAKTKVPSPSVACGPSGPTARNILPPKKGKQPGTRPAHNYTTPNPKGWRIRQ